MGYNSKYKGSEVEAALDLAKTALQEHQSLSEYVKKEEIPAVYDSTLTVKKNGTVIGTWSSNASSPVIINIVLDKSDVGLGNVDNTADSEKSVKYATSSGNADTANKLSETSKTAWGQTFWNSSGVPASISGDLTNVGDIMPSSKLQKYVGKWGNGFLQVNTNMVAAGYETASLWLIGSDTSDNRGVVIARNPDGSISGEMARFNASGLTLTGTLSQSSDIRYKEIHNEVKIDIDTIAGAPLFEFHFSEDKSEIAHIGTSAQYWKEFKGLVLEHNGRYHLDYASLGVALGIILAKEIKDLKEKIEHS